MVNKRPSLVDPEGKFAGIIEPVANAYGCRLVHVRIGGSQAGSGNALEVFLEMKDGTPLTMDTCAKISREVSTLLEVENTMGEAAEDTNAAQAAAFNDAEAAYAGNGSGDDEHDDANSSEIFD